MAGAIRALAAPGWRAGCTRSAACAAVHAHQVAGRLAARAHAGPDGVIASDVIAALPAALAG